MSRTQAYHTMNVDSEADLNRKSNMMAPATLKIKMGKMTDFDEAEATFKLIYDNKK